MPTPKKSPTKKPKLKPIQFKLVLDGDNTCKPAHRSSGAYERVQLLERRYNRSGLDLMYARDRGKPGCLYLGRWGSGFKEKLS